jgi:hypothetical protein
LRLAKQLIHSLSGPRCHASNSAPPIRQSEPDQLIPECQGPGSRTADGSSPCASPSTTSCPPPVTASTAHLAPRLQGRSRVRRTTAPIRPLPARMHDAQELQARLSQAVPEGLHEARQCLPRPQGRSRLHPSEDQEEPERSPCPAPVHPVPAGAQGAAGRNARRSG